MSKTLRFVCDADVIDMREPTGRDVNDAETAFERYGPPGGHVRLLLRCITHINDEPVIYPYIEWMTWSCEKQEKIMSIFQTICHPSEEEEELRGFISSKESL